MSETRAAIVATLTDDVMQDMRAAVERAEGHGPMAADAMQRAVELAEQARGGDVAAFGRLLDVLESVALATQEGECLSGTLAMLTHMRLEVAGDAAPEDLDALDVVEINFDTATPEQVREAWQALGGGA